MTDMQLIRYRPVGEGRWVREEFSMWPVFDWYKTHDVRRSEVFLRDINTQPDANGFITACDLIDMPTWRVKAGSARVSITVEPNRAEREGQDE